MKKMALSIIFILAFLINGCGAPESASVETLKNWSFQYNQGTNEYSLFFGLSDKNGSEISADVDVDIRIENKAGEEVYSGTKSVTKDDFGTYTSPAAGEKYLAEIRIPKDEIHSGKSSEGTVYLTVYKDNFLRFDEVNCPALYCLPISDITLECKTLPVEIPIKDYSGADVSKIQIDNVSYVYEKEFSPVLHITVTGTKTYGELSAAVYDIVGYKIFDDEGYVIESGDLFLDSLEQGNKFKDDSIIIYDIEPGKNYTIEFSARNW